MLADGEEHASEFGEMLFTHYGVSGPIILSLSREAAMLLADNHFVELSLDLKPALTPDKLDARIQRDLQKYQRKTMHNALVDLLPHKLIAVVLDAAYIDPDEPAHQLTAEARARLVQTLKASYGAPSFSEEDVVRSLEAGGSTSEAAVLKQCSHAISCGKTLTFSYRPITGGAQSHRRVIPQMVRRNDDNWYLDAFDLVRQDTRVFRIDRMSDLEEMDAAPNVRGGAPVTVSRETQEEVVVRFNDPRYLDLFYWEGLQLLQGESSGVLARLPYYGGTWLARHLAACSGSVQVSNEALAQQMRTYAQDLLG